MQWQAERGKSIHGPCLWLCMAMGVVVLAAGCATGPQPADGEGRAAEADGARAVVEAYVAARDARNEAAVRTLLTADVDQFTSRGEWRRGLEAAVAGMGRSTQQNPGERTLTVESVRLVSPGVAVVDGRYEIANTNGSTRRLWSSFVVVRQGSNWQIAAIRNMQPAE